MTRNPLLAALVATIACAGAGARPTSMREFPITDIERCYQTARGLGNQNLKGELDLWQVVDEQGDVPATFVHDAKGLDFAPFMSCLTDLATGSKYESQKVDYLRPNPITCDVGGEGGRARCQKQVIQEATRAPFDEKTAQATLTFAGWATATDKGWGSTYARKYADAIAAFEGALKAKPDDVRALRGLAVALADSGGDLKRAREAAQKAVQLKPDSAATQDALVHVCLAQKDDQCTFDAFEAARKAPDQQARSFELALLQDRVKAAAERLNTQSSEEEEKRRQQAEAAAQKADPTGCRKLEAGSDAQLLCLIKRCFDRGAHEYAKNELKPLTGQDYSAGEWKVANHKGDTADVTVQIRTPSSARKAAKKGKAGPGDEGPSAHDATWKVTVGENITMVPQTLDAANIAKRYDACKK